jgi:hypothetical protein
VLLCDKHYPNILDDWNCILSGRQPPHHYLSLKKRWKEAGLRVENDTEERGVTTYRMDPNAGVCGCSAYVTGMPGHGKTKKPMEASENL